MRSKSIIVMAIVLVGGFCQAGTVIVDPNGSADHTTIQAAITASSNGDTIIVRQGTYVENIDMLGKAITLRSTNPTDPNIVLVTIIDGGGSGSVITCDSGEDANTVIEGFLIRNGTGTLDDYGDYYDGGGMYNDGSSPTVSNCTFSENAAFHGGGMCNWYSSPTVSNCTFSGNTATVGGGMYCYGSSPTINNCVFIENTGYHGGGIDLDEFNNLVLTNCSFINNTATGRGGDGGGVSAFRSSLTLTDCRFTGNSADNRRGGGLYIYYCDATVSNCTFSGNTANEGGGVYNRYSSSTLSNCTFSSNVAYGTVEPCGPYVGCIEDVYYGGGGMCNEKSSPDVVNCTFSGNTSDGYIGGGGMSNWNYSSPVVSNCTFSGNCADRWGGGMYNFDHSSPMINNSTFSGNTANLIHGGGMYNRDFSSPTLKNCTFSGNTAAQYGGGMYNVYDSSPAVINCTFSGNCAEYGGGMYNNTFSPPTVVNSIFWGNTAIEFNEISPDYHNLVISYCDIEGSGGSAGWDSSLGIDGGGNIDADPQFVRNPDDGGDGWGDDPCTLGFDEGANDDFGDLHLQKSSPCIDAGDNSAVPVSVTTDLDGNPRILDGDNNGTATVDMGAYELMYVEYTLNLGESVTLIPNGGSGIPTEDAQVFIENTSGPDGATVAVTQYDSDLHEGEHAYAFMGTTLVVETSLSDGQFFATIIVPFTAADLNGADWHLLDLQYWNGSSWELAVLGNTQNSPGYGGPEGDRDQVEDTVIPTLSSDLGDYGVFWNPNEGKGFVWANVDHTTDFAAVALPFSNSAPVADAGDDQTVEQESYDGTEVTLDGSGSTDVDSTPGTNDDINDFDWFEADTFLGSGEIITYTFPLGIHTATLVVTDSYGQTDDDEVTIIVQDTTPPVVDAGSSIIVEQETYEGTTVTLNGSALDNCDAELDYEWSENGAVLGNSATLTHTFSLGTHTLTLKATDDSGNAGTDTVTVTVEDTTPPVITLNGDATMTLECGIDSYTEEGATATDICDDDVPVVIGGDTVDTSTCGTYVVTYDATDDSGNSAAQVTRTVIVEDTIPPEFSLSVEPKVLRPVNHKMVKITPSWEVSDNCDESPEVTLVSITSNEEDDAKGDGHTSDDIQISANGSIYLRAERNGKGSGRIYTITYQAVDSAENVVVDSATVKVPHDKRRAK